MCIVQHCKRFRRPFTINFQFAEFCLNIEISTTAETLCHNLQHLDALFVVERCNLSKQLSKIPPTLQPLTPSFIADHHCPSDHIRSPTFHLTDSHAHLVARAPPWMDVLCRVVMRTRMCHENARATPTQAASTCTCTANDRVKWVGMRTCKPG
jgi:hypothetical protein